MTAKNSGEPVITSQRTFTPAPREYARNDRSISATPPPAAVELTIQITRPSNTSTPWATLSWNLFQSSGSSTSRSRSGEIGGTRTS